MRKRTPTKARPKGGARWQTKSRLLAVVCPYQTGFHSGLPLVRQRRKYTAQNASEPCAGGATRYGRHRRDQDLALGL